MGDVEQEAVDLFLDDGDAEDIRRLVDEHSDVDDAREGAEVVADADG